jgi:hypothetical protein
MCAVAAGMWTPLVWSSSAMWSQLTRSSMVLLASNAVADDVVAGTVVVAAIIADHDCPTARVDVADAVYTVIAKWSS